MISVLCFMTAISGVSAASYDTSKIDTAYSKVIEYYKNNSNLDNADKILAVESLGLEAESNQFDISSVDFSKHHFLKNCNRSFIRNRSYRRQRNIRKPN